MIVVAVLAAAGLVVLVMAMVAGIVVSVTVERMFEIVTLNKFIKRNILGLSFLSSFLITASAPTYPNIGQERELWERPCGLYNLPLEQAPLLFLQDILLPSKIKGNLTIKEVTLLNIMKIITIFI